MFQELAPHLERMALFKVNTGLREQEVCGLDWEWEIPVPELDTPTTKRSVFVIPGDKEHGPASGRAERYGTGRAGERARTAYSPSAVWHAVEQNKHFQNELRFSTPDEWRLRGILGAFWEDNKLYDQSAWMYKELPPCTTNESPGTGGLFILRIPSHRRVRIRPSTWAEP
jgi:hypothetical protein